MLQHTFGPAETGCCTQVKLALQVVFAAGHDEQIFCPADFSYQRLEFWLVTVFVVKLAHAPQVLG
jgi:hypothetical protein